MSGEGVISSDPDIPFGRWHAGRNPRGATHPSENTRDVRVLHSRKLPREDGVGQATPAPSFLAGSALRLHQMTRQFRGRRA